MTMKLKCNNSIPKSEVFLEGLSDAERYLIIVCGLLCVIALAILIDNIIFIWRKHSRLRSAVITTTWIVAMCPTLAVVALMAMLVPNAFLFRDVTVAVSQSVIMYKFVQLMTTYAQSFTGVCEQILTKRIHFNVRPVCCCFICFPTAPISRTSIQILKVLVLQYSVIMVVLTNIIMITWLDGKYIPGSWTSNNLYPYLNVMQIVSVLIAIYALNILVALCAESMRSLYIKQKFNALSLCLIFFSIQVFSNQGLVFDIMAANGVFNFRVCMSSRTMGNFYKNMVFCMEMFLLTLLNLWSYRRPLGPPLNMNELERASIHQNGTDDILGIFKRREHRESPKLHNQTDDTRLSNSSTTLDNNASANLRSSSIVEIAQSTNTAAQKSDNGSAIWLPIVTHSWTTLMGRELTQTHYMNLDRDQPRIQSGVQHTNSDSTEGQGVSNGHPSYGQDNIEISSQIYDVWL